MAATGGDILEITFNHPTLGSGTIYPKSGEDSTLITGGFRSEDEDTGNKAVEEMFCNFNSELFEIGFNAKYIEEAINNVETDDSNEIYLTFSDPNKPALIKPNSAGDNILMLVMPVRLNQ